jgi:hypothetical protein
VTWERVVAGPEVNYGWALAEERQKLLLNELARLFRTGLEYGNSHGRRRVT